MRRMVLFSMCGLVFNVAVAAALWVPAATFAQSIFVLPFFVAFVTFGSAMFLLNGRRLGRVPAGLVWETVLAVPRWAKVGLVLLFALTAASILRMNFGPSTEIAFERTFAAVAVWLSAVGAALHYGMGVEREPGAARPSFRVAATIFYLAGLALGISMLLAHHGPS